LQVLVEKELPACKHQISVPCFKDPAESICKVQCDARLDDCGHTCRRKCHIEDDPDHLDVRTVIQQNFLFHKRGGDVEKGGKAVSERECVHEWEREILTD
jgi:hypothetical protein